MKRSVLSILSTLMVIFPVFSFSLVKSDLSRENLKGKVKSVTTPSKKVYYNEKGMTIKVDGGYPGRSEISYDPDNNNTLVFTLEESFDSNGDLHRRYSQNLDEMGLPSYGLATNAAGDTIFFETYTKQMLPDGKILLYSKHCKTEKYSSSQEYFITFRPDLTMEQMIISDASRSFYLLNEDELPLLINEPSKGLFDKGEPILWAAEYLPNQRNFYILQGTSRILDKKEIIDNYGNTIEVISYNPDGTVSKHKTINYTYDNIGNWIRKEEMTEGKSQPEISERTIEYY